MSIKNWSPDKKIIAIFMLAFVLSFGGCVTTSLREIITIRPQNLLSKDSKKTAKKEFVLNPKIHPQKFLPERLNKFTVVAIQPLPGAKSYAAEGIYKLSAEGKLPHNVRVDITYHSSVKSAAEELKKWLENYPEDRKTISFEKKEAYTGMGSNRGSYLISWIEGKYSIEIDGSFTEHIPKRKDNVLKDMTLLVAKAVAGKIDDTLKKQNK